MRTENMELEQTTSNGEIVRNEKGQFLKGSKGLGGRQKGSRNKLGEAFVDDVYDIWQRRGMEVLERLANEDPAALARLAANLLPQKTEVDINHAVQIVQLPAPRSHAELEDLHMVRVLEHGPQRLTR